MKLPSHVLMPSRVLLGLMLLSATVGLLSGLHAGRHAGRLECGESTRDLDERREFALRVASVAFDVGETQKNLTLVALAHCGSMLPRPPMVP